VKFLTTLQADLRERQIFPAVVLLAVLAIAIPIVAASALSKVSTPPPVSSVQAPFTQPKGVKAPAQELAVLNSTTVSSTTRRGAEPNPFREAGSSAASPVAGSGVSSKPSTKTTPAKTTPAKTTPAKTTPAKTTPAKTTPAKTTPASTVPKTTTKPASGGSHSTPTTPTTGPDSLKSNQAYTVDVDTKDANGVHVLSDLVRLAPLPAAQTPEVIYLGVMAGGKKAAFLFTNAIAVSSKSGGGLTCLPSTSACQIVELSPGQGLSLYPTSNSALIATFTFELVSIGATSYSSADAATAARDAVSTAGETLLPLSSSTALATLTFSSKTGALVHHSAPSEGSTGSTGSAGAGGSSGAGGATGATGATGGGDSVTRAIAFALSPGH
jgi:uncharacterized membrane protein YgcG